MGMRLDHYSIRTLRLDETRRFYADVLGMHEGPRPPFSFPGAWMYSGDTAMVHLIGADPNDTKGDLGNERAASTGTGAIDHVAFAVTGLDATKARLHAAKLPFRERTVPRLGLHQVFIEDPNGITLELNFPETEAPET